MRKLYEIKPLEWTRGPLGEWFVIVFHWQFTVIHGRVAASMSHVAGSVVDRQCESDDDAKAYAQRLWEDLLKNHLESRCE